MIRQYHFYYETENHAGNSSLTESGNQQKTYGRKALAIEPPYEGCPSLTDIHNPWPLYTPGSEARGSDIKQVADFQKSIHPPTPVEKNRLDEIAKRTIMAMPAKEDAEEMVRILQKLLYNGKCERNFSFCMLDYDIHSDDFNKAPLLDTVAWGNRKDAMVINRKLLAAMATSEHPQASYESVKALVILMLILREQKFDEALKTQRQLFWHFGVVAVEVLGIDIQNCRKVMEFIDLYCGMNKLRNEFGGHGQKYSNRIEVDHNMAPTYT